jgi:quinol monooxygenase YgiN
VIRKTAQYQIKHEARAEVEHAIREFVTAVAHAEPFTEYVALELEDGVSYLHLMGFPSEEAEQQHRAADYTRKFVDVLYPCCVAEPTFTGFTQITP